jgi:hypothetical protein
MNWLTTNWFTQALKLTFMNYSIAKVETS